MSKNVRFINGVSEKKIATLQNTSTFGGCVTKTVKSQRIVSEAVRFRVYSKKNPLDVHYIEGILMLDLGNGNVILIDENGDKKIKTNMFDIKADLSSTMEETRNALRKNSEEDSEESFIKCLLIKHIYTHYAPLYPNISPDICGKVL